MNNFQENYELSTLHDKNNYQVTDLDSEIDVDRLCAALLKNFHQYLLSDAKFETLEAGSQAAGADYFLREFMVGHRRDNIFNGTAELVRQFAGHWYIISTLEPNMDELGAVLNGTISFYLYCAQNKLVAEATAEQIKLTCSQLDYYQQRIEDFHDITGDGFSHWKSNCPLD